MNAVPSPATLTNRIQQLVSERQRHADALAAIDQTLTQISSLLGAPLPAAEPAVTPPKPPKAGAKHGSYPMSAEQSILAFVQAEGSPTTAEIRHHWQSEGRPGNGSPVLARLVMAGKVKRSALKDGRGSRYSLAAPLTQPAAPKGTKPSGRRPKHALTGEESVLAFVKEKGNPTTQEVKAHWEGEKRGGRADNVLSLMVQAGKLRRIALKDKPGSRYEIVGGAAKVPAVTKTPPAPKAAKQPTPSGATGTEVVLQIVRELKNPSTADVTTRWQAAGRSGRPYKPLADLVKAGKLKRSPIKDGQGSRYTIR